MFFTPIITVNVVLSSGAEYTHVFDEVPNYSGNEVSVLKQQFSYYSKKIAEAEKALSVYPLNIQKKKYINASVSVVAADIKWCYENMEKELITFKTKFLGNPNVNNKEWLKAYKKHVNDAKNWFDLVEEKEKLIEWVGQVNPVERKKIEDQFSMLKNQLIKHLKVKNEIKQKLEAFTGERYVECI